MKDLHAYRRCLHFDGEVCLRFPVSPAEEWWGPIEYKAGIEPRTVRIYKNPVVRSEPLIQHSRGPIALVITLGSFTGGVIASEDCHMYADGRAIDDFDPKNYAWCVRRGTKWSSKPCTSGTKYVIVLSGLVMPERKNMAAASGAESAGGNAGKLSRGAGIPEYLRVGHGSVYRRAERGAKP